MKKILLSLAAVGIVATAAAPAAAQPWRDYDRHDGHHQSYRDRRISTVDLDRLNQRISQAVQHRQLSWREGRELREQTHRVRSIAWRNASGRAVTREEYRLLVDTVRGVDMRLSRYASNNPRYGYGDRSDWRR